MKRDVAVHAGGKAVVDVARLLVEQVIGLDRPVTAAQGLEVGVERPSAIEARREAARADKAQVAFMVRALLGLSETPPPDAADALAIALAHLQASDPIRAKLLDRRLV